MSLLEVRRKRGVPVVQETRAEDPGALFQPPCPDPAPAPQA